LQILYDQPPAACQVKSFLAWGERLASPDEAARYDPTTIFADSQPTTAAWFAELLTRTP
jgi:hypothetical protein